MDVHYWAYMRSSTTKRIKCRSREQGQYERVQIRASNDHPVLRHCMQISYVLFIRVRRLTKAVIFHVPQKKVEKPGLQINGTIIEHVNNFNFLGITINNHLNCDNHINKAFSTDNV